MLRGPDAFYQIALAVAQGVADRLDPAPERSGVVPGAIPWDACDCGQLAVSLAGTFPANSPPVELAEGSAGGPCAAAFLVASYAVQVARCAPVVDEQGNPPSVEAQEEAARLVAGDAWAARLGVRCALEALRRADDIAGWRAGPVAVQGPEGGCVGVELAVQAWIVYDCAGC
jgi:hypothetical protein